MASAITNLADTVISVAHGEIEVIKNREFGTLGKVSCDYNPCNRRIYSSKYGDTTMYSWDHTGIALPEDQAQNYPEFAIRKGNHTEEKAI